MEKMKMMSCDIANENVVNLSKLFPECITEVIAEDGKTKKAVDFAVLNQIFCGNVTNYSTGGGLQENAINLPGQTNQRQELL